jgi:hypothetical protein
MKRFVIANGKEEKVPLKGICSRFHFMGCPALPNLLCCEQLAVRLDG